MATAALRGVGVVTLWSIIFLCAALLLIEMYCCMAYFWINEFMVVFELGTSRTSETSGFLLPPALLGTFFAKQIIFTWPTYLAIALLAIWLRNPPFRKTQTPDVGQFDPRTVEAEPENATVRHLKEQAKLFFLYQLPPRRVWAWLIDGGFNVVDLIVVVLWATLNAFWMYLSFLLIWPDYYLQTFKETGVWTNGSRAADILGSLGYASAWAAVYNLVFLFMPIPRNSFLQYLFNTDFATLIRYHRWLGHGTLWISLLHGIFFYAEWLSISVARFREETFAWQWEGGINYLAGSIAFFPFGLMLWITTIPWIRRKFFKVFLSTHIIGFLGFYIFVEIHYPSSIWYLPGLALYFLDVTFRLSQWGITSGVQCQFVSADKTFVTLKLKFNKATKATVSQFLFVNMPDVSRWEWHPISIAGVSSGADGVSQDVTLHMKAYGSWTKKVIQQLAQHGTIPIRVDGPYGCAVHRPEWAEYDTLVMVAGGIGITPLLGMLREMQRLQSEQSTAEGKGFGEVPTDGLPAKVHLIWAVRNRDELQLLDADLLAAAGQPGSWLKLDLFHTSKAEDCTYAKAENGTLAVPSDGQASVQPIVSQLQPYGFGDCFWALSHILSMGGAFFACLMVSAYVTEGELTSERGNPVWGVGLLMSLAFIVGSMGLPALFIFPMHLIRYRRHVRACEEAYARLMATNNSLNSGEKKQDKAQTISEENMQRLLPSDEAKSGALDLETGKAAAVSTGRPDLVRLIASVVTDHPQDQRIGVIASGPSSLVVDARLATHSAGKLAAKLGKKGIPELAFSNHSFTF